jgi:hypothetical protein
VQIVAGLLKQPSSDRGLSAFRPVCEVALALQRDPLLHDIAARYLGGQAKLITMRVWWSFPTKVGLRC